MRQVWQVRTALPPEHSDQGKIKRSGQKTSSASSKDLSQDSQTIHARQKEIKGSGLFIILRDLLAGLKEIDIEFP